MISDVVLNTIIALFCFFGTSSTMTSKLLYQFEAPGLGGDVHKFEKPLFQSTMMFVGMALCMLVYYWELYFGKRKQQKGTPDEERGLLDGHRKGNTRNKSQETDYRIYYLVAVPAICDFVATYMMTVGLLWVNASIYQMVRGSIVLFSALIRWGWLGKRIYNFQWFGVFLVMLGEVIVGFSAILGSDPSSAVTSSTGMQLLGIALIFLAQLVQACQVVVEEHLLHNINASAYQVVGLEGIWGFFLCVFVSVPICKRITTPGIHEDMADTLAMMENAPNTLIPVTVAYTLTILGFNLTAMKITEHINSVTRCVLDTVRTVFIWILMTTMHYTISPSYGEPWNNWCWMQLLGFAVLMFGLFTYYQVVTVSWFEYPSEKEVEVDPVLATPLLTPSQRRKASGKGKDFPALSVHKSGDRRSSYGRRNTMPPAGPASPRI